MDKSMYRTYQLDYLKSDSDMCSNGQEDPISIFHTLIDVIKKLDDDRVHYFAKLAAVIPRLQDSTHCDGIDIPEYPQFWTQVLDLLVKRNEWRGVDLLIQPRNGPWSPLDGRAAILPTADIRISSMLSSISDVDLNAFGVRLAITLLEKGTPLESIVDEDEEPLMIAAVRSATRSGNLDLMKYVLERQPDLSLQIDQPDSQGDSPIHLCVKSPSLSVTHRCDLLELLLGLGCCVSVRDGQGKTAVQYLDAEDPCHQLLEQASLYAGEGLRKRMDRLKALGDSCFKQDEYREALKWYREAMVLAESVPNLKLDLALLHSSCSAVYVNFAIMEDEDEENSPVYCRGMEELLRKKTQLLSLLSNHKTPAQLDIEGVRQGQGNGPTSTSPDTTEQLDSEDNMTQEIESGPTIQLDHEGDLSQGQGDGATNTSLDTSGQLDDEDDMWQGQGDGPSNTAPDTTIQFDDEDDLRQRKGDAPRSTSPEPTVPLDDDDAMSQGQGDGSTSTSESTVPLDDEDDLRQGQGDGPSSTSTDTNVPLDYEDDLRQGLEYGPTNTSLESTVQLDDEDDLRQGQGDEPTSTSPETTVLLDDEDDLRQGQGDGPTSTSPDTTVQLDDEDDLRQGQGDGPTSTSPDTTVLLDDEDDLRQGQGDGPSSTSPVTTVQLDDEDDLRQGQGDGPTNTSPDTSVPLNDEDDVRQGQGDGPTSTSTDTTVPLDDEDDLRQGQGDGPTSTSPDTTVLLDGEDDLRQGQGDGPTSTSPDTTVLLDDEDDLSQGQGDGPSSTSPDTTVQLDDEADLRQGQGNGPTSTSPDTSVPLNDEDDVRQGQGDGPTSTSPDTTVQLDYDDIRQGHGGGPSSTSPDTTVQMVSKEQDEEEYNAVEVLKPRRGEVKSCEELSHMLPEGGCSLEVIPADTDSNVTQQSNVGTMDKHFQNEVSGGNPKINQKIEFPAKPEKNYPSCITEGNKMPSPRTAKPEHNLQMLPKTEGALKEDGDICEVPQSNSSLNTSPRVPSPFAPRQLIDCTEKEVKGPLSVDETTDEETEGTNELSSSSGSNTLTGSDASNVTVISRKPESSTSCVKVEKWLQTCDKGQPKSLRVDADDVTSKTDENTEKDTMTVSCEGNHSEDAPAHLKMDSLQNGQLTTSTTEEEKCSLEKMTAVAVDEVKQKEKAICHSCEVDSGRTYTSTDHSNRNKEQTMEQDVHIDTPDCANDIPYGETSNGKKQVASSDDVKEHDKSTNKDTVKCDSESDVIFSDVHKTVPKESNEKNSENTNLPSQAPPDKNKRKTRKKKKKKEKKKMMAGKEQTSEATQENDSHGMKIHENVDIQKSVISETHKEEKMQMVKSVAERPVLTVSECKADILEMIQNSSCSILESISGPADSGLAENADSRKEQAETAGGETEGDDMGILDDVDNDEDMGYKPDIFDNLPWEVEFTADAWKHLRSKSVQMRLKQRTVKIITELANGNWSPDLYKPVSTRTKNIFISQLSRTTSLIWERAVAFSGRCSDSPSKRMQDEDGGNFAVKGGRIYTQIIRVWDIVSSDDDIQKLLGSITTSYKRGKMSLLKRNLQSLGRPRHTEKQKQFPLLYAEQDMRLQETTTCMFFPPASPDPREYHILKFYAFTHALVNIVLSSMIKKADLPFKVTDKEHAIIHLSGEAPILLLGRSGTGKTTSCLYRLWTNFISYWRIAQETGAPFIPRLDWVFAAQAEDDEDGNPEDDEEADTSETTDVQPSFERQDEEEDLDYGEYDHLHQIFVTKNPVLCTEVHKNFYELCHACDETADHVEAEYQEIPPRLQDVEDLSYPLFLTSKQLLMMLDGSLGQPYFFERDEDGSLGVTVRGWEEQGDALGISLMDQDSDDEDFMGMNYDYDEDVLQPEAAAGLRQRKLDPRKEVTYEVFASTIWPKIKKRAKYHPSLVWTEIMSFIKGSYEALATSEGHLSEKDYIEVGRKKAPNFSGERETVYQLFERYVHFKKQNLLFDEADLVSDIFKRLKSMDELPWTVHQLYVDETQDFTQAELSVLLRITQHPNDMFLTGDTAQGIMRGISFRFCDLKSLFFHAKKSLVAAKQTMLNEPKQVYQLTHSYRSHGGILALASAVLDLMVEFFPESFDKLKKDQGLLDGPLPLLMESCSPQDLAILLQGNNRKASHIEFGAHQAILVVNNEAKEKMPDMLSRHSIVLTIYESKGLEFDDILLYNFFTDSQATKEWRVVTTFLETLAASPHHEEQFENLHIIDAEMLTQPNRPRALAFEANEHKILNSELKYLYTALTRARVNVWIFDEDEEKRAPMFEYFKARQLVRCISQTADGNSEFTHMVFAMKSSPEDWVKRGDEMMSQTLYEVAVNCYRMGGDDNKEQIAVAHCQAQGALKLKDSPRKMREEFVCAAHKFLHCGEVIKAATCLQNAREFELAAKLFKRMKKFQEAVRLFQRSGKHVDTSECYEELGWYNRAVELLDKEELYELGIDCLKRYQTRILEMRGTDRGMLKILESNKPGPQFTLENLYFKLVRFNHKQRNKLKMLAALDHLPYDDQLEFLEKHQYLEEAVDLMLRGGKSSHSDVAQMLLRHGATRDALYHAEKGTDVDVRGKCHHALALELYLEMEEKSQHEEFHVDSWKKKIVSHFQKAATAFEETDNNNSAGMAVLVIAMIQNRIGDAKRAFGFFKRVSPFANEAGMVESMKIIVGSVSKGQLSDCQWLVTAVETLLTVINTLLKPDSREKHSRCTLYLKLYGLHQDDKDPNQLIAYPRQMNLCADALPDIFSRKDKRTVHLDKQHISYQLSLYLIGVLKEWIKICRNWLDHHASRNIQCRSFLEGRCVGSRSCDNSNCRHLHERFIRETALKGLKALLLKVKLEDVLHRGVKSLQVAVLNVQTGKTLNDELTALADYTLTSAAFEKLMQHFIIPESHHLRNLTENEVAMRMFRGALESVNLKSFIQEMVNCWCDNPLKKQCKSSDWLVRATILVSLFKIQHIDLKKVYFNIKRQLQDSHLLAEQARYAFISFERDNVIIHLGGLFYEAFDALKEDPISSVFEYSKFVKILGDRNMPVLFPKMPLFLFWHEVFITVALTSFAKLSSEIGRFVLPATYLATLPFVSAMLPQGSRSIQWSINSVSRDKGSIKAFQDHIQRLAGVLCGSKMRMNLLSFLFRPRKDFDYIQAERCLILALVVLANVGQLLDPPVEVPLMEAIMRLELPDDAPTRLKNGLQSIKESHGIADLVVVLQRMLKEREDEYLLFCEWKWNPQRKEGIQHQQLKSLDMFPSTFVNFVQAVPHAENERDNNAARVLQRFFRKLTLRRHIEIGNLKQRFEQQILKEQCYHSGDYVLDEWSATNEDKLSSSAEEDQREKDELNKYLPEKQKDRSARILQQFFRKLTLRGYIETGNLKQRCEQQMVKEKHYHFEGHVPQEDCTTNVEEISISAEEAQREKDKFNKYLREEQEDKSARILQRFFRRLTFTGRIEGGNIRARYEQQEMKEIFSFYDITEDQCGVCGVTFKVEETDKPSFESDLNQMGTRVEMIEKEEGTQPEVFEHLLNQQKTSQLREEHLSSRIHTGNMMNFNLFKKLYKEYFVSKMPKIRVFIEQLRKGEICMDMADIHFARLEFMMREVQVLYEGIFYECNWDQVFVLTFKVNPLCAYYYKVSEELEMKEKQVMVQVDQQPQLASGDGSSIPDITRPAVVEDVEDKLLDIAYEVNPRVATVNAEQAQQRQNTDYVHQGHDNPMVQDDGNRGVGYGGGGASQQYMREDGRNRHGHGNHGRHHGGHIENNRGQQGHRGGPGVYHRGGQGNSGPHEYYGRGYNQPGQGDFGREFGQQGGWGGPGLYYRGGQGNRGPNEYYGRGYDQPGQGGFIRGFGEGGMGGQGVYHRGGQGNRGPNKYYGRGYDQPGQGGFGRGFGEGGMGGQGVYHRGGQGNRGSNEYYGRGYNQCGVGGSGRGYGRGRGREGAAGHGRGSGHLEFPNAPPRHRRQQQLQQFHQQRHQLQ